jgi:hypothetical protein
VVLTRSPIWAGQSAVRHQHLSALLFAGCWFLPADSPSSVWQRNATGPVLNRGRPKRGSADQLPPEEAMSSPAFAACENRSSLGLWSRAAAPIANCGEPSLQDQQRGEPCSARSAMSRYGRFDNTGGWGTLSLIGLRPPREMSVPTPTKYHGRVHRDEGWFTAQQEIFLCIP